MFYSNNCTTPLCFTTRRTFQLGCHKLKTQRLYNLHLFWFYLKRKLNPRIELGGVFLTYRYGDQIDHLS